MNYLKLGILVLVGLLITTGGYLLYQSGKIQDFYANKGTISGLIVCKIRGGDYMINCMNGRSGLNGSWKSCEEYGYTCHSNNNPQ